MSNLVLIIAIASILMISTISADPSAFADKDRKYKKTLEEKCEKQKYRHSYVGLFCGRFFDLKKALESFKEHIEADKDLDDTNELQTLALEGSTLSISGVDSSVELPTGDEGTPDGPLSSIKLEPQSMAPLECNIETAGTIFYHEIPGQSSQMCACVDTSGDGDYGYKDLFTDSEC